jgi:hypothetical protein
MQAFAAQQMAGEDTLTQRKVFRALNPAQQVREPRRWAEVKGLLARAWVRQHDGELRFRLPLGQHGTLRLVVIDDAGVTASSGPETAVDHLSDHCAFALQARTAAEIFQRQDRTHVRGATLTGSCRDD